MKLIGFPVVILLGLSIMMMVFNGSVVGFGFGSINVGGYGAFDGLWDLTGHPVCYLNGTAYGEDGILEVYDSPPAIDPLAPYKTADTVYFWYNNTDDDGVNIFGLDAPKGWLPPAYPLYDTEDGENKASKFAFDIGDTLGFVAVIVGLMAVAGVVGLHVLGSGISDTSVATIIKGGALLALWGIVSYASLDAISTIPMFGGIIYFVLTALYTFGFIEAIT